MRLIIKVTFLIVSIFFILCKSAFADYKVLLDISPSQGNINCVSGVVQAGMDLMPTDNPWGTPYTHLNVTIQGFDIVVYVPESVEVPNVGMVPTLSLTTYLTYTYSNERIWYGAAGPLSLSHSYTDTPPYLCHEE